jgi:hypothetical protein
VIARVVLAVLSLTVIAAGSYLTLTPYIGGR